VIDNNIFAGGTGLWRRPLSEMVAVKYDMPSNQISKPIKIVHTEYFNLAGQRLKMRNNKPFAPRNTLVIERKIDADGVAYPEAMVVR